jgi:RNA polymerase sigma factor (sigma-70 family)
MEEWLAQRFEENRAHLRAVAYHMLGSQSEAEDAVQESWLRVSRADRSDVQNLTGWLTTVTARVCLNMLQSRKTRHEEPLGEREPYADGADSGQDPEQHAVLADSVGVALLVVLDTLNPAERLAFVLHDMFAVPFEDIAPIVGRSPAATRQLASRARRRVQGSQGASDRARQRDVVNAFLAASREGDFAALLTLLDPDVVLRVDAVAAQLGAVGGIQGADAVAAQFAGRARAAQPALVDGTPGAAWAPHGSPRVAFRFTISDRKIVAIDIVADPERMRDVTLLDG